MSEWIKASIRFDDPAVILTLSRRDAVLAVFNLFREDPDKIEAGVLAMIDDHRPELSGGVLYGINFDMCRTQWEFYYAHRSLPKTPLGDTHRRMPLIPDDEPSAIVEG